MWDSWCLLLLSVSQEVLQMFETQKWNELVFLSD